ncbi:MAG: hypothetical protein K9G13_04450 [Aquiluna sp.]|nr:hypothetical protein [Aquiluna sp.]MCF8545771.1 hypothetical protein [Aquiluna sp.]
MNELAVIFNPQKISIGKLQKAFTKQKVTDASFFATEPGTNGAVATKEALALGAKHLIIAGGDGTIRAIVQELMESKADVTLSLLPVGTGNILARNLSLSVTNLDANLKRAINGSDFDIDLGIAKVLDKEGNCSTFFFTGIAGVGMDARIMQRTDLKAKKRIGWFAYIEGGFKSLPLKFEKFDIQVDDQPVRTIKSYSVLVGNAGWLPGLISMMPDARLDDARLDIALIGPRKFWNWVDFLSRITWQNQVVRPLALGRKWLDQTANLKTIENLNGSRIRIRPHHPVLLQVDGDPQFEIIEADFKLLTKGLRFKL